MTVKPKSMTTAKRFPAGLIWQLGIFSLVASLSAAPSSAEYADDQFGSARKEPLTTARAMTISEVLKRLEEIRRRFNSGEDIAIPKITLDYEGGSVSGWIIGLDEPGETVVMQAYDSNTRFASPQLCFIKRDEINAIKVFNADSDEVMSALYEEWQSRRTPPPTRLEIKRRMANFSTFLFEKTGTKAEYETAFDSLPESDQALCTLASLMNVVTSTLVDLSSQNAETSGRIKKVIFAHGGQPRVTLSSGALSITGDLQQHPLGGMSRATLRAQIESAVTPAPAK